MRHRGIIAAGLLAPALLLSGCSGPPAPDPALQEWLDDQSAAGPGPSIGGLIDGVTTTSLGLVDLDAAAYDAEFSCSGTDSVRIASHGEDFVLECTATRVERVQPEGDFSATVLSDGPSAWHVRLTPVDG